MPQGIDYFNRGHWLSNIQARASYRARRRMFDLWLDRASADLRDRSLLDVGATSDQERLDSNCMLPWFRDAGLRVTLYSPEDISNLIDVFPFAKILARRDRDPGIPVPDGSFDWVTILLASSMPPVRRSVRAKASRVKALIPQWASETRTLNRKRRIADRPGLPTWRCSHGIAPGSMVPASRDPITRSKPALISFANRGRSPKSYDWSAVDDSRAVGFGYRRRAVRRAVVGDDDFARDAGRGDRASGRLDAPAERLRLVAAGDHDADLGCSIP